MHLLQKNMWVKQKSKVVPVIVVFAIKCLINTWHLLEHGPQTPMFDRDPAFIQDYAFIRTLASSP